MQPNARQEFYSLLFGDNSLSGPTYLGVWGDSTCQAITGSSQSLYANLEYRFFLQHGHTPGTGLYQTFGWGAAGAAGNGDWIRNALVGNGWNFDRGITVDQTMPGFYDVIQTGFSCIAFEAGEEWRGWGNHAELNHHCWDNNDAGDAAHVYGFSQGAIPHNQGSAAFRAGTAAGTKSAIDMASGIFVEAYAASWQNASSDNPRSGIVHYKPITSLAGSVEWGGNNERTIFPATSSHVMFGPGKGQDLRNPAFNVYRDVTPVLAPLSGAQRYMRIQYGGGQAVADGFDSDQGALMLVRFRSNNKRGVIVDGQGVAGFQAHSVLLSHGSAGPWYQAIGYKVAFLVYGINDDTAGKSPATYKSDILALMSHLCDYGVTHFVLLPQWNSTGHGGSANYQQYAGALYEISQMAYASIHANCRGVLFWNTRKILDRDFAWNATPGQDCADSTGHLSDAGCFKVGRATVPLMEAYLGASRTAIIHRLIKKRRRRRRAA